MTMAILKYDGGSLSYTLTRRKGMKNIRIRIKTDGSICVSADTSVTVSRIEEILFNKLDWIKENSRKIIEVKKDSYNDLILQSGVMLSIFGSIYELCVKQGEKRASAYTEEQQLIIEVINPESQAEIEMAALRFIAEKGRHKAEEAVSRYLETAESLTGNKCQPPKINLKILKSKWGHYNPRDNEIMLNYALAGLPECLFEYVAAHETAHIFVRNHSAEFYILGEKLITDFKKLNKELNKYKPDLWENVIIGEPLR